MNKDIENIIKKNLPENLPLATEENHTDNGRTIHDWEAQDLFNKGRNSVLSQINTSLIADEVLKVVVENIKNEVEKILEKDEWGENNPYLMFSDLEELLFNLSPNKENKNNEK